MSIYHVGKIIVVIATSHLLSRHPINMCLMQCFWFLLWYLDSKWVKRCQGKKGRECAIILSYWEYVSLNFSNSLHSFSMKKIFPIKRINSLFSLVTFQFSCFATWVSFLINIKILMHLSLWYSWVYACILNIYSWFLYVLRAYFLI